jgi:RNA polymerase sigma-70 factor (ECF subfamily)
VTVLSEGSVTGSTDVEAEADEFDRDLRPLLPAAHRLALGMLLRASEAEDAVQEASLRAWRYRRRRRPNASFRPWFLAIVINECRDRRRSRWLQLVAFEVAPKPLGVISDEIMSADLGRALARLPAQQRAAIVLRYYLDLPLSEVAEVVGCTVDAAKFRIHRGLQRLRQCPELEGEVLP